MYTGLTAVKSFLLAYYLEDCIGSSEKISATTYL